jgi:pimeloyl-ACP methyl ester carboxylesterase
MNDWNYSLVTLRDGRVSEVLVHGDQPRALVWFSGTPGAAVPDDTFAKHCVDRDLRLVMPLRPGYGQSTPRPGRRIIDFAEDVDQVLQHFGLPEVVCMGGSGGGPNALAMARALPQCRAAGVLVSPAPRDAEGLDFYDGMALSNQRLWRLADQGEDALRPALEEQRAILFDAVSAESFVDSFEDSVAPVDRAAMLDPDGPPVAAGNRKALEEGIEGWVQDDIAMTTPWGFELAEISKPVTFWTGRLDQFVSWRHTVWMAERVPGAHLHVRGDEGHISLRKNHFPTILDDVLERAGW